MKTKLNKIYERQCGDLNILDDMSIDVVVTSPPYNLSYRKQKNKKFNLNGYGDFSDNLPEVEYQDQQVEILEALGRVLKDNGSIFYNHKDRLIKGDTISPHEWIGRVRGLSLYQTIVWDRGSSHNVDPIRLPPTTEYIFWFSKSGHHPRFYKDCRLWGLVWQFAPHAETRLIPHPAPFPVAIPLRCLMMAGASVGDVVLDPFMGSGTTAVAATILGASYIGYEINTEYVRLAESRIEAARELWYPKEASENVTNRECKSATPLEYGEN